MLHLHVYESLSTTQEAEMGKDEDSGTPPGLVESHWLTVIRNSFFEINKITAVSGEGLN